MKLTAFLLLGYAMVLSAEEPAQTADGFSLPQPHRAFVFPRDHGSHPGFRTEWWYVTGHLDAPNGSRFGFQLTFFRQAGKGREQLFLAHSTLLDVSAHRFLHEERLNREGWDASASGSTLDVRNGNWSLALKEDLLKLETTVHADARLALLLKPRKQLVVFGQDGVSHKGSSPQAASHYLTWPRLGCEGTVNLGGDAIKVTGEAWMDHEFSSSQLDEGQVGWDWACLQFNDGREIMVYRMRRKDGSSDPSGTTLAWVLPDGSTKTLKPSEFQWQPVRPWTSPRTHTTYPLGVRLSLPEETFELHALFDGQELGGEISGLPYWEGACDVTNPQGRIVGRAFLELAGYAGDLAQHLRAAN